MSDGRQHPFRIPPPGHKPLPTDGSLARQFWANGVGPSNQNEVRIMFRAAMEVCGLLPLGLAEINDKTRGDLVRVDDKTHVVTIWRDTRWSATVKVVDEYPVDVKMTVHDVRN